MAADRVLTARHNAPEIEAAYESAPEDLIAEILHGALYLNSYPTPRHQMAAMSLYRRLVPFDQHEGRSEDPRGWLFLPAIRLHLGEGPDKLRPDLAAWRVRERPLELDVPVLTTAPDWVCEVFLPGTATYDRVLKAPALAAHGTEWVWFVDVEHQVVESHHNERGALRLVGTARAGETLALPPFESASLAGVFAG